MSTVEQIKTDAIKPSPTNPRKTFNDESLKELAHSIKANGILQPILVRPVNGHFELIAGERRWRAAQLAKQFTVPAIVREATDAEVLRWQLVENAQREDVNVMEEAEAIFSLRDKCSLDVSDICKQLGKSNWYVYRMLSLCKLSDESKKPIAENRITRSVALYIAGLPPERQDEMALALAAAKPTNNLATMAQAKAMYTAKFNPKTKTKQNKIHKEKGHDYCENWKYYLVRFSQTEFWHWKSIVKERTDTDVLAEAVEAVMLAATAQKEAKPHES